MGTKPKFYDEQTELLMDMLSAISGKNCVAIHQHEGKWVHSDGSEVPPAEMAELEKQWAQEADDDDIIEAEVVTEQPELTA